MNDIALIVDTHSNYSDVWEPCFHRLDRYCNDIKKYAFTDNAYNIPNGSYTNNRSGNKFGESVGGPLKDKEGKIINNFLQQYSSKNTYLNSLDGIVNNIPPTPPQPSVPTTPTIDNILPKIPKDIGGGN